jgi:hypothetical protein
VKNTIKGGFLMNSLVNYNERGNWGNNKYRGNCSGKLIVDLHEVYKFGEISDYMRGSNTTGETADFLKIKSNTYDLNTGFDLVNDDIKERNKFILFHPPYWDIIKYSGNQYGIEPLKNDLSHIKDYKEFLRYLNYCIAKQYSSLKTGGRLAVLLADIKKSGVYYPLGLDFQKFGTIESIVIKAQNNCYSDKIQYSGKFIKIAHEYLVIMRKDNPYLTNIKITKNIELDIRDSEKITWRDLVAAVLEKLGGKATLKDIYSEVEGHKKTSTNSNWMEKIRQTLQRYDYMFRNNDRGVWVLAK